ncbi:hypothetical protein LEP1GSC202_3926 [Leptospira yanagawae serovar Saopaulo str. Sao Paulo = ATCC 700523]|uniref:Tetratricopeptide repeat protein n=1 Tax=Leptospira yanagawae serovar Saopaulo str. Sao Paulo = ATCC 700523 TaxID=1249483 RepID=A0A5E8HH25_9LEPT|nr:hypothetical protein LEP1GSC202_3926 [Leptospira yanagawae serovar Saopaulo str. Sao Paulo = ATCC 700523]
MTFSNTSFVALTFTVSASKEWNENDKIVTKTNLWSIIIALHFGKIKQAISFLEEMLQTDEK